jgi:hypothetical protein
MFAFRTSPVIRGHRSPPARAPASRSSSPRTVRLQWLRAEIQRVCREYGPRGVGCTLIYEDVDAAATPATLDRQVRAHLDEFKYGDMPAVIDRHRTAAGVAKATITPTAVVVDGAGAIRYRGRIDNLYAALGKPRQQITSPRSA